MVRMITAVLLSVAIGAPATGASITNKDGEAQVVTVVEGGTRTEVALDAGATETICPAGCFVTLPNGDRIGLQGGETVEIKNGAATVK